MSAYIWSIRIFSKVWSSTHSCGVSNGPATKSCHWSSTFWHFGSCRHWRCWSLPLWHQVCKPIFSTLQSIPEKVETKPKTESKNNQLMSLSIERKYILPIRLRLWEQSLHWLCIIIFRNIYKFDSMQSCATSKQGEIHLTLVQFFDIETETSIKLKIIQKIFDFQIPDVIGTETSIFHFHNSKLTLDGLQKNNIGK